MSESKEERSFKSYFFEKDDFVEQSIRNEFGILLTASLINVDLRKERRFFTIVHIAVFVTSSIIVIPLLSYTAYLLRDDLVLFTNSLHYALLGWLTVTLIINLNYRADVTFEVHSKLACNIYRYDEPYRLRGARSIENEMAKEKRLLNLMPVVIIFVGFILCLAILIDEYFGFRTVVCRNGVNMKLIVPMYTPFESYESHVGYLLANGLIFSQLVITTICLAAIINFYAVVFQRNILQFQTLRLSISQIDRRASALYAQRFGAFNVADERSELFETCLIECLKHNIQHYNALRSYFVEVDTVINNALMFAFVIGSIIIGLSVVLVVQESLTIGNKISTAAMCLAEIANMFLLCVYGERLTTETKDLLTELYSVPWYSYGLKFKRLVFQFKEVIANPLIHVGGGLMPTSLETFTSIMNTAYSYYQFLAAS